MTTNIFYYTSTGNSLHVAKRIKKAINNSNIISMAKEHSSDKISYKCENVILVYPVHCFGLPIVAVNFIEKLELEGCKYIYAIAVSGGGNGKSTFKQLNGILDQKGCKIDDCETIKYCSNYIKSGRNASEDRVQKCNEKNEKLIDEIIERIKNKSVSEKDIGRNSGAFSYKVWKSLKNKDKHFKVDEKCVGCEICEKICPIKNIEMKDNKPAWNGSCVECMACINLCPKKAINIGNKTVKKERYKNKNINVNELFRENNIDIVE